MKTLKFNSLLILFCVVLASCSLNSEPNISLGKEAVQNEISQDAPGKLTVSNFAKTNGIKREVMERSFYTMEYTAQMKVDQKCWHLGGFNYMKCFHNMDDFANYNNAYYSNMNKIIFNEGAVISFDGKIDFEKTENGWRAINCNLNNFNTVSNPEESDKIYAKENASQAHYSDDKEFFNAFKQAVLTKDLNKIAEFINFPLEIDSYPSQISKNDFVKGGSAIMDYFQVIANSNSLQQYQENDFGIKGTSLRFSKHKDGFWKLDGVFGSPDFIRN
jgi:hypothetical protein